MIQVVGNGIKPSHSSEMTLKRSALMFAFETEVLITIKVRHARLSLQAHVDNEPLGFDIKSHFWGCVRTLARTEHGLIYGFLM